MAGGAYAVLVRRQLSSANHESSSSLASIDEEAEAVPDDNADLMNRTETGKQPQPCAVLKYNSSQSAESSVNHVMLTQKTSLFLK